MCLLQETVKINNDYLEEVTRNFNYLGQLSENDIWQSFLEGTQLEADRTVNDFQISHEVQMLQQ